MRREMGRTIPLLVWGTACVCPFMVIHCHVLSLLLVRLNHINALTYICLMSLIVTFDNISTTLHVCCYSNFQCTAIEVRADESLYRPEEVFYWLKQIGEAVNWFLVLPGFSQSADLTLHFGETQITLFQMDKYKRYGYELYISLVTFHQSCPLL